MRSRVTKTPRARSAVPTWPDAWGSEHHEENFNRRHHAGGARELSAVESAPEGLSPLLWSAGGGAQSVRKGDGDRRHVAATAAHQLNNAAAFCTVGAGEA